MFSWPSRREMLSPESASMRVTSPLVAEVLGDEVVLADLARVEPRRGFASSSVSSEARLGRELGDGHVGVVDDDDGAAGLRHCPRDRLGEKNVEMAMSAAMPSGSSSVPKR